MFWQVVALHSHVLTHGGVWVVGVLHCIGEIVMVCCVVEVDILVTVYLLSVEPMSLSRCCLHPQSERRVLLCVTPCSDIDVFVHSL